MGRHVQDLDEDALPHLSGPALPLYLIWVGGVDGILAVSVSINL